MYIELGRHLCRYRRRLGFEEITIVSFISVMPPAAEQPHSSNDVLSIGERDFAAYFAEANAVERIRCKTLLLLRAALLSVTAPSSLSPLVSDWQDLRRDFDRLADEVANSAAFARLSEAEQTAMWTHLLTLDTQ